MEPRAKRITLSVLLGLAALPGLIVLLTPVSACGQSRALHGWWLGAPLYASPFLALLAVRLWWSVKPIEVGAVIAAIGGAFVVVGWVRVLESISAAFGCLN